MGLLLSLLPIYLFGNFHCLGMCGPLVMLIGRHHYRVFYFLGRMASFTLTGWLAGYLGLVLQLFFNLYHVSAFFSLLFGLLLVYLGCGTWIKLPRVQLFEKQMGNLNKRLSVLILKDQPLATFLFGFFTILLPCGQTLIVFSAIAMHGVAGVGALNGFIFALLTSPALFIAMRISSFFTRFQKLSNQMVGLTAALVGILSLLRGFAELGWMEHLILSEKYHMVMW